MKLNKNKIIISVLSVALIGTSTVAGLKVNHIKNDSKGAKANMSMAKQTKKESAENAITTKAQKETSKNTTQAKVATTKKAVKRETTTTTTTKAAPTSREIALNQTLHDNNGDSITFTKVTINDKFILISFKAKYADVAQLRIDGYDISFVSNTGAVMGKPNGYGYKYRCDISSSAMLAYDPSVTSITATYTFDDGTTDSTVISLK